MVRPEGLLDAWGDAGGRELGEGEQVEVGSESGSVHEPPSSFGDRGPAIAGGTEASGDGRRDPRLTAPAARLRDRRALLPLALILVAAAAVRLVGIGRQSFSVDEMHELRIANTAIADIVTFGDGFPPLYNLLFHFFLPLGDLAGRVLSALLGVATVGVTWGWARRIGGARMGLWAASLVALAPLAVQLSGEGRAYGLMALLAAASLWSLWVALDSPSALRWARWGLVSALGVYTHYLFAALVAAGVVVALVEVRGRSRRAMWAGIGVFAVLAAPAIALLRGDMASQIGVGADAGIWVGDIMYAGYRLFAGFYLGTPSRELLTAGAIDAVRANWVWIAVLAPPVGLLLVQGYRTLDRVTRRRLLALSVLGLLLESAAIKVTGVRFGVRYFFWLVVPLTVWLAAGLTRLRPRWRWAAAAVLLVVAVFSIAFRSLNPHHQVEDARGIAIYLESSGAVDHPVLLVPPDMARPIVYYMDRSVALALPDQWDPKIGRLGYYPNEQIGLAGIPKIESGAFSLTDALEVVDAHTQPGEPYYLIYARPFYSDREGELLAALTARDELILVKSLVGAAVYRGMRTG